MKVLCLLALAIFLASGCAAESPQIIPRSHVCPSLPEKLPVSEDGVPLLRV